MRKIRDLKAGNAAQYPVFQAGDDVPIMSLAELNQPTEPTEPRKTKNCLANSLEDNRERYKLLYASIAAIPDSRVTVCKHIAAFNPETQGSKSVKIGVNGDGETSFMDAAVCGSVWLCPVCNPRIAKQRQQEILHSMRMNRERGGVTLMLTLTFSHDRNDVLAELLKNFSKALSKMKGCRKYKNIKKMIGYLGSIRALEFTHSDRNGWHPHVHEIFFLKESISEKQAEQFRADVFELWEKYAVKCGLGKPNEEHGVDVKYSVDRKKNEGMLASYVSGMDYEITHLHTKESKEKGEYSGRTPWEILKSIAASKNKNERDVFLWRQFANAVHGRNQLFWSRGLKKMFEVEEFTDQQAAEKFEAKKIVRVLDDEEFYLVCHAKKHAEVLEVARLAPLFLDHWFKRLKKQYEKVLFRRRKEKRESDDWIRENCDSRYEREKAVRVFCMVTGR